MCFTNLQELWLKTIQSWWSLEYLKQICAAFLCSDMKESVFMCFHSLFSLLLYLCSYCGWLHIQGWVSEQTDDREGLPEKQGCGQYLVYNILTSRCFKSLAVTGDLVWIHSFVILSHPSRTVCPTFLFRVRWMSSLNTAQTLPWQPLMVLTVKPMATATMAQELPGLPLRSPLKSPTRRNLTHKLLLMDSPSQGKENGFKYLNF